MTMDIQALILSLLIGAVAGWLTGQVMRGAGFGLIANIIVGMVGALVAGWLFPSFLPITGIAGAIVQSAIGAIIVLAAVGLVKRVATDGRSAGQPRCFRDCRHEPFA